MTVRKDGPANTLGNQTQASCGRCPTCYPVNNLNYPPARPHLPFTSDDSGRLRDEEGRPGGATPQFIK